MSPARALAAALCCLPLLAAPAAAEAALTLTHVRADAVEVNGNQDDVIGPGDEIRLNETVQTATTLTGATASLFSPTPGITLQSLVSGYANAAAGAQSTNVTPFRAVLASTVPCGANLSFALAMDAAEGQGAVSFLVPTGSRGPLRATEGGARSLELDGSTEATLTMADVGRVKAMEVRIGSLTHPDLSDLRLEIIAPDGTVTLLAAEGSLSGTALTGTVFAANGVPIGGGAAPYNGRFAPVGSLTALEGRTLDGTWTLRVTDTAGGSQGGSVDAWGLDAAKAFCSGIPKARFTMTPSRIEPGGTVQFDASASSDTGGSIASYAWDLDGDGEYDDATGAQAQRTYTAKQRVQVKVRVTDNEGLSDTEEQTLPVTVAPVAAITATPSNPLTGQTVRLQAGGSVDPDGTIVRYQWDTNDDGDFDFDTQGTPYLDVGFPLAGTVDVAVKVTDEDGADDTETTAVVVRNRPPVANIADPGLVLRDRVTTLSAAASSDPDLPDGAALTYAWDLDGNGTYETSRGTATTVDYVFTATGPATVGVRVTDEQGDFATTTRSLVVTRAPVVPLTATPNPVSLRRNVVLDASGANDPDNPAAVLTYEWDLENDGTYAPPAGPTLTTSWSTAGTRTVKLRVTDPSGAVTVASVAVVVRNVTPVATVSASPASPRTGQETTLTAAATDADGTVVRYQWDLDGDGSYERDTGTTPTTTASFANPGNVTVGVRVTDDDGGAGTKLFTLTVLAPEPPPPVTPAGGGSPAPGGAPGAQAPGDQAPPAGPGDAGSGPGPVQEPGDRPFAAWLGGAAMQRLAIVQGSGLLVSCRSEVAVWCSIRATVAPADARRLRLKGKARNVARTAVPVPAGQVARQRLKLSARARRALRAARRVRIVVNAVAAAADGRRVELTRVVLVRA